MLCVQEKGVRVRIHRSPDCGRTIPAYIKAISPPPVLWNRKWVYKNLIERDRVDRARAHRRNAFFDRREQMCLGRSAKLLFILFVEMGNVV